MNLIALASERAGLRADILDAQGLTLVEPAPIIDHLCHRFGFAADLFEELAFFQASHKIVRVAPVNIEIPLRPPADRVGVDFLRIDMANPRMTTTAVMTWGHQASTNAVDTDRDQCLQFLRRSRIQLRQDQLQHCTGRGFVIIRHLGHGLGVGFLESTRRADDNFAYVRSMYPKAFSNELERTSPFGNPL